MALKPRPWGENVLLALDLDIPSLSGRPLTGHLGLEWQVIPAVTLRAGLDQNLDAASSSKTSWNPTFGTSLHYAGFRFDYAFHAFYDDPTLSNNYVSLSYQSDPTAVLKGETF
jgi:hypothetical protein